MDLLALFTSRVFGENLCVTESHSVTFSLYPIPTSWLQAAAEQWKEELTVSCICRAPSFPFVYIQISNGWGGKKSQQINSLNWHRVSVPLSINMVEVEICWPLSSATLHGWESPQGAGIVLAGESKFMKLWAPLMPQEELQLREVGYNKTHWPSSAAPYLIQHDIGSGDQYYFRHNRLAEKLKSGLKF